MSPAHKPRYVDPSGDPGDGALPTAPPFIFRGVTSRVFPLRANMSRLSAFCDQYLNMDIPPTIARFRPSLPYVYLMVLNYGSMSPASVRAQNLGWVSQHEMTFTVPLEWWREEGGRLVFKNWACVSPFIFVDDQLSLTTGREVYGWPKVLAEVDADIPLWTQDPLAGERVFTVSTPLFPRLYAGQREVPRVLVQIDRAPPPTYSVFPPDPSNPWTPLASLGDALRGWLSLTGEAIDIMLAPGIRGYHATRSPESLRAMCGKALGTLAALLPDPSWWSPRGAPAATGASARATIENITLKQFRAVEDPNAACYQALVSSSMGFERLNQGGLMGDVHLLRGDPSGGFTVRIHRYAAQPIIESLGLEVASESDDGGGAPIAVLKPTLPFWNDVDLFYDRGRVICSRSAAGGMAADSRWRDEQPAPAAEPAATPALDPASPKATVPYNSVLGAATQPVCGPFAFPDVTLQVYPLLADPAHLARLVDRTMNAPLAGSGLRFQTCGSYVYLLVSTCADQLGSMWSATNNIGWWGERELSFAVPVKVYQGDELVSLALLTPFVYANSGRAVISDREVNGRAAVAAAIDQPADAWLTRSGPVAERSMLRLATEMFPALDLRQRAESRTLLEIDERPLLPYNSDVGWNAVAQGWGERMAEELARKTAAAAAQAPDIDRAKALALEPLALGRPFDWIGLKQYRDAEHVGHACYQALVRTRRAITHIYDAREIENGVHVRVHKSVSHPIVERLGLAVKSVDSMPGVVVENLQPWRPFWMRLGVEEQLGELLAWRDADGAWTARDDVDWWLSEPAPTATAAGTVVRPRAELLVAADATVEPQNLAAQARARLRAALARELDGLRRALPEAAEQRRLRQALPAAQQEAFARWLQAEPLDAFCQGTSTDELLALTRALLQIGLQPAASCLERLTVAEAREAIARLDELQLVVESILSDEWENWGAPRWWSGKPPKPAQSLPVGSVYGTSAALAELRDQFARGHGLATFEDAWWYVAPPPRTKANA
ncbi:hypothetical protein KF840_06620 [bacterium]|nr:hypothetical protein [bacterium]